MKILLVKLKNLHTSACLQLNYCTKKQTKNAKVANIVELIKTSDQTLVNFGNFFNYNCNFYPLFLLRKKYLVENAVVVEWTIPVCLGDNDKNMGRVLLGGMSKIEQIQFFDSQMYLQ